MVPLGWAWGVGTYLLAKEGCICSGVVLRQANGHTVVRDSMGLMADGGTAAAIPFHQPESQESGSAAQEAC